jgi:hypothetical protein
MVTEVWQDGAVDAKQSAFMNSLSYNFMLKTPSKDAKEMESFAKQATLC